MKLYKINPDSNVSGNETYIQQQSLWEGLELSHISHSIISIVGGGGKTSVMYQLAKELAELGKRVIVTTSTHISYPSGYQVVMLEEAKELEHVIWEDRILVVGGRMEVEKNKFQGMDTSRIHELSQFCDVLLVEADGAKRLPIKLPAGHEPVIVPETNVVIGCVGLDCIGQAWKDVCFRWEIGQGLLGIQGDDLVSSEDVASILLHEQGTHKDVGRIPYRIVLNKTDNNQRLQVAAKVQGAIRQQMESGQMPVTVAASFLN